MIDFITQMYAWGHANLFDPERIPIAVAAIILSAVIGMITGPIAGNANPLFWQVIDRLFGKVGDKLDKPNRSHADLVFRGFFISMLVLFLMSFVGKTFEAVIAGQSMGGAVSIILLSLFLSTGTVWFVLLQLYFAMDGNKDTKGSYRGIARSTRTNLNVADNFGIVRMGMNFSARSFDKNLVAPVLWFLIAGFVGSGLYTALAALSWRFGKNGTTKGFGGTPIALEKLLGFFPSLLSGILITLASLFTPTAKLHKGITAWFGHKNRASYAQGGFALSALAWSLNVSLGGPAQDFNGDAIKNAWVGPDAATAKNDHKHLKRALYINIIAHILFIAVLLGMYVWSGILNT